MSGLVRIGHVRSDYVDPTAIPPSSLHNLASTGTTVARDGLVDALLDLDR